MLTQKSLAEPTSDPHATRKGARPQDDTVCWFEGQWTPLADAKVSIMTHAFLYGTAVFEGIRAYWNADEEQLFLLKAQPHFERIVESSKILLMRPGYGVDEMVALTVDLLKRNTYREDCYVRATVYKSDEAIGVKLHDLESRLNLISIPFGDYIATDRPISCGTVSWRRTGDLSIPSRGKVVGSYVNPAFSKTEAVLNGYEEAIVLDQNGHVSEGSAENLFLVRKGRIITPGVNADILEGITRAGIIELVDRELGLSVEVRDVDRSELYVADEVFLCGTGAQVSPVSSIDHRTVGNGGIGPITQHIMTAYFDAVRGRSDAYRDWLLPVY